MGSWAVLLRKDFRSSSFSCYCLFFFHVLASVCHSMWNSSGLLRIVGDHSGIILRFFQDSLDIVRLLQASSGNVWFLLRFFCLSLSLSFFKFFVKTTLTTRLVYTIRQQTSNYRFLTTAKSGVVERRACNGCVTSVQRVLRVCIGCVDSNARVSLVTTPLNIDLLRCINRSPVHDISRFFSVLELSSLFRFFLF